MDFDVYTIYRLIPDLEINCVTTTGLDPIKVLLVDDHEIVRRDLACFLETYEDLDVIGKVNNGREALAFCAATKPDIIVMDLVMPIMDGVHATQAIVGADNSIRVIVLTGSPDEQKCLDALQAGALVCLHKNNRVVQQLHSIIVDACGRAETVDKQ